MKRLAFLLGLCAVSCGAYATVSYTIQKPDFANIESLTVSRDLPGSSGVVPTAITESSFNGGSTLTLAADDGSAISVEITTEAGYGAKFSVRGLFSGTEQTQTADSGGTLSPQYGGTVTIIVSPITYYVAFAANGGSGTMARQTFTYDGPQMLSANGFTRENYDFLGWENTVDGATYSDREEVNNMTDEPGGVVTLTARWSPKTYKVTLNAQGGAINAGNVTSYTYGVGATLPVNVTRTGYTFDGWFTAASGGWQETSLSTTRAGDVILYAHWTARTCAVTFGKNGGTGGTSSVTATYDSAMPSITPPTRTGYTFGGYYGMTSDESTKYYNADGSSARVWDKVMNTATLYAKWTPNRYKVTFDKGGGTGGDSYVTATYGSAMPTPRTAPMRTGYAFDGYWAVVNNEDVQYYDGNMASVHDWDKAADSTLYAKWTPNRNKVTFDKNGGTGGDAYVTATYSAAMPTPRTAPKKTGYTFEGYWTTLGADGIQYYDANMMSVRNWDKTSDTTLWAKWTANAYHVRFNANGGEGEMDDMALTYGVSTNLAVREFSRDGYGFAGWTTNSMGDVVYGDGAAVSNLTAEADGTITLYAKWTAAEFTVTLDVQGGTGGSASVVATYGSAMPALVTSPTRDGYTFGGYYDAMDGLGTQYYNANGRSVHTWDKATDSTLYAYWVGAGYKVTFGKNGGTGGDDYVTATYGSTMPTPRTAPRKAGYTFEGYWTTLKAGGVQYYDGSMNSVRKWDRASATTLWAKWTANAYIVQFNANGGEGEMNDMALTYGSPTNLSVLTFDMGGYGFAGWATNSMGDVVYGDGAAVSNLTVEANDTVTLYAKWTPNRYKVTFGKNGGTGGDNYVTVTYGLAMPTPRTAPIKTGYTFVGYYGTTSDENTKYYNANMTSAKVWDKTSDTTLWAKWTANTYYAEFEANGGSGTMAQQEFTYGTSKSINDNKFKKDYYDFLCWTNTVNGLTYTNRQSVSDMTSEPGGVVTLTALWTPKTYKVTLNTQGGTINTGNVTSYIYGVGAKLPTNVTKTGYTFDGWFTTSGDQPETDISTNRTGDVTLYAKWTVRTCTVTFGKNGGTGGINSVTATFGSAMPSITPPTRTGYTFGGYYGTTSDESTKYYSAYGMSAKKWDKTSDMTLWAKWTANAYHVRFNANGGKGEMDDMALTYGSPTNLPVHAFDKEGYGFAGWATNSTGDVVYGDGAAVSNLTEKANDTVTLYAHWTARTCTVTFGKNGGTGGDDYVTATYGLAMPTPRTAPKKTGYTFGGYWTTLNAGGVQYYDGNMTSVRNWNETSDMTLWAKWTPRKITVKFFRNYDPDGTEATRYVDYDDSFNMYSSINRPGYKFEGWADSPSATEKDYDPEQSVAVSSLEFDTNDVVRIYAVWSANTYKVYLDMNDGTDSVVTNEVVFGSQYGDVLANPEERVGYVFDGWWDQPKNGKRVFPEDVMDFAGNRKLYAQWTSKIYDVTFNANGGGFTNGTEKIVLKFIIDETYGDMLPDVTNSNEKMVFEGWRYRDTVGNWVTITSDSSIPSPSSGATNMVSHWTRNDPLARALDAEDMVFEMSGNPLWIVTNDASAVSGSAAYVKGPDSGGSWFMSFISVDMVGTGVLTFRWRIDSGSLEEDAWTSENSECDTRLSLHIDSGAETNIVCGIKGGKSCGVLYRFSDFVDGNPETKSESISDLEWIEETFTITAAEGVTNTVIWMYEAFSDTLKENKPAGEAWLDRVTWTPSEGTDEITPTHLVPYAWLRQKFPDHVNDSEEDLERLAESDNPNGKKWPDDTPVKVWQDYVAGTNPTNETDLLRAHIGITNNQPYVWWTPPAGTGGAQENDYRIIGAPSLEGPWTTNVVPSAEAPYRFFKVDIVWPRQSP